MRRIYTGDDLCQEQFFDEELCLGEFFETLTREAILFVERENKDMVLVTQVKLAEFNSNLHMIRIVCGDGDVVHLFLEKGALTSFRVAVRMK